MLAQIQPELLMRPLETQARLVKYQEDRAFSATSDTFIRLPRCGYVRSRVSNVPCSAMPIFPIIEFPFSALAAPPFSHPVFPSHPNRNKMKHMRHKPYLWNAVTQTSGENRPRKASREIALSAIINAGERKCNNTSARTYLRDACHQKLWLLLTHIESAERIRCLCRFNGERQGQSCLCLLFISMSLFVYSNYLSPRHPQFQKVVKDRHRGTLPFAPSFRTVQIF